MEAAVRTTLQASSRLALRTRPCPNCSSYALTQAFRPSQQKQQYSTTPRRNALGETRQGGSAMMGREIQDQMGESVSSKMKGMSKAQLPNDLGLFPGTFTQAPLYTYLPLISKDFRRWLRIQWKILRKPVINTFGIIYNLYWVRRAGPRIFSSQPLRKKPIPLHLTNRKASAIALHRQLYEAISNGNRSWLSKNCCSSLAQNVTNRIDRRDAKKEHWKLVRYGGPRSLQLPGPLAKYTARMNATVVNDVVGQLPMASDALLRQCTVRIKSVQEYRKKRGQQIQTKAVTEYIVMQKMIWQGEDEPWKIWGTVEPSTEKEITELFDEERAQGGLADRVRSLMPNVGGGGPMM